MTTTTTPPAVNGYRIGYREINGHRRLAVILLCYRHGCHAEREPGAPLCNRHLATADPELLTQWQQSCCSLRQLRAQLANGGGANA